MIPRDDPAAVAAIASALKESFDGRAMRLIVLPTEQCNFRCVYCYEEFKIGKMKLEVVKALNDLLAVRWSDLDQLHVTWFGGEPLLARDVIRSVMTRIAFLNAEVGGRVRVVSDMSTNGYLLDAECLQELYDLGIRSYQISFDGDAEFHDKRRVTRTGKGSLSRLVANIDSALATDLAFVVYVRLHVDANNVESTKRFLVERAGWLDDPRIVVTFEKLEDHGVGLTDASFLDTPSFRNVREDLERTRAGQEDTPYVCYAARPNNFVVRADGRIQKCTVALSNPNNTIGHLEAGGRIVINENHRRWTAAWRSKNLDTLRCPAAFALSD